MWKCFLCRVQSLCLSVCVQSLCDGKEKQVLLFLCIVFITQVYPLSFTYVWRLHIPLWLQVLRSDSAPVLHRGHSPPGLSVPQCCPAASPFLQHSWASDTGLLGTLCSAVVGLSPLSYSKVCWSYVCLERPAPTSSSNLHPLPTVFLLPYCTVYPVAYLL